MLVGLLFDASTGRYVRRRRWHPTQKITKSERGGELTMEVQGTTELKTWILGWGDQVEVLEPESLRDEIATEVARWRTSTARLKAHDHSPRPCSHEVGSGAFRPSGKPLTCERQGGAHQHTPEVFMPAKTAKKPSPKPTARKSTAKKSMVARGSKAGSGTKSKKVRGAPASSRPARTKSGSPKSRQPKLTFIDLGSSLEMGEARCSLCAHSVWSDAMGFSDCDHTVLIWTTNSDFGGYCDPVLLAFARKRIKDDDDEEEDEGDGFEDMMSLGYWLHEHGDEVAELAPTVLEKPVVVYAVRAHDDTFIAMVDAELVPTAG